MTLIISKMNDLFKIIQALKDSNILLTGVSKTIKSLMSLSTLGASLLGNLLTGKGNVRAGSGYKKGKGIVRAGSGKKWDF